MSLFRKPTKKIQRRVFEADDDDDGEPEAPPPPVISRVKKDEKPIKTTALLSFADEEEDGEVFKVKKSSQSKKLSKKRVKVVKKIVTESKYENNIEEEDPPEILPVITEKKTRKKVTLEGLILSGRDALAAGAGDMSDEGENVEDEEEETGGFHRYRAESVRAALAVSDAIPDAALIHAARKSRQQARELGGDFIPVRPEPAQKGPGSRLIRDDGSGDDEEEGRIIVRGLDLPSDKPKRGTAAAEAADEVHSEDEQWEEQQMQKAVTAAADGPEVSVNPFSVAPPPPRLSEAPPHLQPLPPHDAGAGGLVGALTMRLDELQNGRAACVNKSVECRARLARAEAARAQCGVRAAPLARGYRRAQALRAYLTDLVECIDEKLPQLEGLESRARALWARRCELVRERRRQDLRDQAQDVLAMAARAGAPRAPDGEAKTRRAAEREGRRRDRRLRREAHAHAHLDGDSSDDELTHADEHALRQEMESIRAESASLLSDALPAWRTVSGVCARLSRGRRALPGLYADAYLSDWLPRLLAPYVRHQLILWNPLADEENEDIEKMDWYKCLAMYGVRRSRGSSSSSSSSESEGEDQPLAADDPDLMLIPTIINKVVVAKLTELIRCAWDPLCVRSVTRLRAVVCALSVTPPRAAAPLRQLSAAAADVIKMALSEDVYLPALPAHVLEGAGGVFWRRCLGAGVRLVRALFALCAPPHPLRADALALKLIGTLCLAAGAAPAVWSSSAAAALCSTLPRGNRPLRAAALQRLAALATAALANLHSDNPLHLKALEQVRSVLAEAKACEKEKE